MILEAQLPSKHLLLIDCENSSAITKSESGAESNPDKVLEYVRTIVQSVATELAEGLALTPAKSVDVEFAVRVNNGGEVVVAQTPNGGQFRVTLRLG